MYKNINLDNVMERGLKLEKQVHKIEKNVNEPFEIKLDLLVTEA